MRALGDRTEAWEILDLVQESVFVRGLDGRILSWNQASVALYGWRSDQAVGRLAHELLGTVLEGTTAELDAGLQSASPWHGELTRTRADGTTVVVAARWCLRRDADGRALDIVESGRDITESRRALRRLHESEYRYRNLFQAMAVSFWELDFTQVGVQVRALRQAGVRDLLAHLIEHPEVSRGMTRATRVVDVNEQTVALFGRGDKAELLGSVDPFWPDASLPVFAESVVAAVTGKPNLVREMKARRIDGSEFHALFTACFAPESTAKGLLTVGVIDLSARQQAYEALEQSEFRYRSLFQAMAVGFWQIDSRGLNRLFDDLRAQGVTDLSAYIDAHPGFVERALEAAIAVDVNERTIALYGAKSRDELLGPVSRVWIPGRTDAFRHSIEAGFRGEFGYQEEARARTLDGREIDILYFMNSPPALRALGMVLVGNIDISEQVAARETLRTLQAELAHASRVSMLGELTASIAHEVNQPLAAIVTHGEAGLRWLDRPEPDLGELRTITRHVVADAHRAAAIIARVRSMAARRAPERSRLDLREVIEEAARFLHHELRAQGVDLTLEFADDLPPLLADRIQLQQVTVNLVVNGIQAMSDCDRARKRIAISTRHADPGEALLLVEDAGPGIPQAHQTRVFESFYSTKPDGMGMGLPICRSIVEDHGGRIGIGNDSRYGGARISVALPTTSPGPA